MTRSVALVGANGKMGRLFDSILDAHHDFEVVARLGSSSSLEEMLVADLVVDVTKPGVSQEVVAFAVEHDRNVLVGTSGWSGERLESLARRLETREGVGVIVVPNFSLGSVLATRFAAIAGRFYDSIEIIEAHHAGKLDSPSGTAVRTAELIQASRAELGPVVAPHIDQMARGQQVASIPIHSLRLSGVVAKQDVLFGGDGEVLTLTHETISTSAYEKGIILALGALQDARGLVVGLDQLIDFSPNER